MIPRIWEIWAETLITTSCIIITVSSILFFCLRRAHPLKGRIPSLLLTYNLFLLLYFVQQGALVLFSHPSFIDVWFGFLLLCICSGLYVYRAIRLLFLLEIAKNLVESHFSQGARLGWYVKHRHFMHPAFIRKLILPFLILYSIVPALVSASMPLTEMRQIPSDSSHGTSADKLLMWGSLFWSIVHLIILGIISWKMRNHVDDVFSLHSELKYVFRFQSLCVLCHIIGACLGMGWWWSWIWLRPPQWASFFFSTVWPMVITYKWFREEEVSLKAAPHLDYDMNTLEHLLLNEDGFSAYVAFLRQEFNSEMALFWREVHRFKNNHEEALLLVGPEALEIPPLPRPMPVTSSASNLSEIQLGSPSSSPILFQQQPQTTTSLSINNNTTGYLGNFLPTPNSSPSLSTVSLAPLYLLSSSSASSSSSSSSSSANNSPGVLYTTLPPSPPMTLTTLSPGTSAPTSTRPSASNSPLDAATSRLVYKIYSEALRIWDRFLARDAPFEVSVPESVWNEMYAIIHLIRHGDQGTSLDDQNNTELPNQPKKLQTSPSDASSLQSPSLGDVNASCSGDEADLTRDGRRDSQLQYQSAGDLLDRLGTEKGEIPELPDERTPKKRSRSAFWGDTKLTASGELMTIPSRKDARGCLTSPRSRLSRVKHLLLNLNSNNNTHHTRHEEEFDNSEHKGERMPFLHHRRYRSKSLPPLFFNSNGTPLFSSQESIPTGREDQKAIEILGSSSHEIIETNEQEVTDPPTLDIQTEKSVKRSPTDLIIQIYDEHDTSKPAGDTNETQDNSLRRHRSDDTKQHLAKTGDLMLRNISGESLNKDFEVEGEETGWDMLDTSSSQRSLEILIDRQQRTVPPNTNSNNSSSSGSNEPMILNHNDDEKQPQQLQPQQLQQQQHAAYQTPKAKHNNKKNSPSGGSCYPDFVYSDPPSRTVTHAVNLSPSKTYSKTPTDSSKNPFRRRNDSKESKMTPQKEIKSSLKKIVRSVTEHVLPRETKPMLKLEKIDARVVLHAFDDAQTLIYNQMKSDSFVRFRRTSTFVRIATRQATQRSGSSSRRSSRGAINGITGPRGLANSLSDIQPRVNQILHQAMYDASMLIDNAGSMIQLTENNKVSIQPSQTAPTLISTASTDVPKTTNTSGNPTMVSVASNLSTISTDSMSVGSIIQTKKHGLRHAASAENLRPALLAIFARPEPSTAEPSQIDGMTTRNTSAATSREPSTNRSTYASTLQSPEYSLVSRTHPSSHPGLSSQRSSGIYVAAPGSNSNKTTGYYSATNSVNPSPRSSLVSTFNTFSYGNYVSNTTANGNNNLVGGNVSGGGRNKRDSGIVTSTRKIGVNWGGKVVTAPYGGGLHPTIELQDSWGNPQSET